MFDKIKSFFVTLIGKVHWRARNRLTKEDHDSIRKLLSENYYIILTHRSNHLSTYFIALANLFLVGKLGFWGHVLMNLEDTVEDDVDFRLVEAIGTGVRYSKFKSVFSVSSVALLKPKSMTIQKWTIALDKAKTEIGKPYDTLFDLTNDSALSCVELVRDALRAEPDYATDFTEFEKMILEADNLTPDMFYACPDFEVVFEIRR